MALVRNETFGVLSIEPSGPYGLLEVAEVTESTDLPWPVSGPIAQTYACGDLQPVGHACMPDVPTDPIDPPVLDAPSLGADGSLDPGTYYFVVTALNANGETTASNEVSIEVEADSDQYTVNLSWAEVEGATSYNVYAGTASGVVGLLSNTTDLTFTWDGTTTPDPEVTPPDENTTGGTEPAPVPDKRFDGLDDVEGTFVTIQGGLTCGAMGLSGPDALQYARGLFEAREGVAVEREFLTHVLAGAEDITPTDGPVSATVGLALAEGYAISNYAGRPYIHAPSTVGSYLFARGAAKIDGISRTKLNNPLVVGGGYDYPSVGPDGDLAEEGTYWLYVTGRPVIVRGALGVYESMNYTTNDEVALAERPYVLAADCFAAAINVTLEG